MNKNNLVLCPSCVCMSGDGGGYVYVIGGREDDPLDDGKKILELLFLYC